MCRQSQNWQATLGSFWYFRNTHMPGILEEHILRCESVLLCFWPWISFSRRLYNPHYPARAIKRQSMSLTPLSWCLCWQPFHHGCSFRYFLSPPTFCFKLVSQSHPKVRTSKKSSCIYYYTPSCIINRPFPITACGHERTWTCFRCGGGMLGSCWRGQSLCSDYQFRRCN